MALIARLPDGVVARLVRAEARATGRAAGGATAMVDLALKMLLDDKARFADHRARASGSPSRWC